MTTGRTRTQVEQANLRVGNKSATSPISTAGRAEILVTRAPGVATEQLATTTRWEETVMTVSARALSAQRQRKLTMPATPCCSQDLRHFVPRVDLVDMASSSGSGAQPPGPGGGDEQPRGREVEAAQLVDLMNQCARGQEDAFAQLYDLTSQRIYSIILRVLRSPDHAAEVTQEVYVEIWRQSARYAPDKGSVIAWMTTMAHRRAVDRVRSVSSEAARDERYAYTGTERDVDVVWDSVEQKLDVERVRRGMASLTAIQREALTLAYFGGYTQSQVAQLLKLPLGTVKTRIRDGLIGLRDALGVES